MDRQYIGARYVPLFANPVEWNANTAYEALTIVTYMGASYTSMIPVPAGTPPTNTEYWVNTGNYNAQIEQYRQEVVQYHQEFTGLESNFNTEVSANDYTQGKTIVIFGDSYGEGIPMDSLTKLLPNATIYNASRGGTCVGKIVNGREGIQSAFDSFRTDNPSVIPDIVLVYGFNNDVWAWAQNEDGIRANTPFGTVTDNVWTTTAGALNNFIAGWQAVNNKIKFGLIPLENLADDGYYLCGRSALDSILMHYPNLKPVSILWRSNFFALNKNDPYYWNNSHPTDACYKEVLNPIMCTWLKNGMKNNDFTDGVYTIMTPVSNNDIVTCVKDASVKLFSRINSTTNLNTQILPSSFYVFSTTGSLDAQLVGSISFQPYGNSAYYVFSIENTPSNMYSAFLKETAEKTNVYVKSQL